MPYRTLDGLPDPETGEIKDKEDDNIQVHVESIKVRTMNDGGWALNVSGGENDKPRALLASLLDGKNVLVTFQVVAE